MIRVLIVDDSPTLRHLVRAILEQDPEMQVVGEPRDAAEAVRLCLRLQPDVVTMDIRMPNLNGFEATQQIMSSSPRPIVVLTSSTSDRELGISFKAIEAGALCVVGKPHGIPRSKQEARALIDQVKAMAEVKVVRRRPHLRRSVQQPSTRPQVERRAVRLVAIGASTGGPPALHQLLGGLPAALPVPIVVVQHISPGFIGGLASWLDEAMPFTVKVAANGDVLQPATVYLAPDDRHLQISSPGVCWLRATPPVDGHRPSVTVLLRSVAASFGSSAVGVVLTGMGHDGTSGLLDLRAAGGRTIAQDQRTSIVYGMPRVAAEKQAAQEILALDRIADRLFGLTTHQGMDQRVGNGPLPRRQDPARRGER
jgi:two-component system chemotaxis response regulator CheB